MPSLPPPNKAEQRKLWRRSRAAIPADDRIAASNAICRSLQKHPSFTKASHIAGYLPLQFEVNIQPLLNIAHELGKQVWIPRVIQQTMDFARYHPSDRLETSTAGTLQPIASAHTRRPEQLDLILVPLLAFTRAGIRLGMGGGFYDRTFSFMLTPEPASKPTLSGVAFARQEALNLPTDPWDVPVSQVVTQHEWIAYT